MSNLPVLPTLPVQSPPSPSTLVSRSPTALPLGTVRTAPSPTSIGVTAPAGTIRTAPSPVSILQSAGNGSSVALPSRPTNGSKAVQLPSLSTLSSPAPVGSFGSAPVSVRTSPVSLRASPVTLATSPVTLAASPVTLAASPVTLSPRATSSGVSRLPSLSSAPRAPTNGGSLNGSGSALPNLPTLSSAPRAPTNGGLVAVGSLGGTPVGSTLPRLSTRATNGFTPSSRPVSSRVSPTRLASAGVGSAGVGSMGVGAGSLRPASLPNLSAPATVSVTTTKLTTINTPPRGTANNSYNSPTKSPVFDTPKSLAARTALSAGDSHATTNISAVGIKFDENSVDYALEKRHFTPMSHVLLRGPDNTVTSSHIKVNVNGLIAYVELDADEGFVMRRDGDSLLVYSADSAIVPLSVERSIFECVGDLGCGAVFECENGICTLSRADSEVPRRTVMTIADRSVNRMAKTSDDVIAYPVVRLSEVMFDACAAENIIREATCRIRNAAFDKMAGDLKETDAIMDNLNCVYHHFQNNFVKAWKLLRDQICQLEKARDYRENLLAEGCLSEEDECKHRKVLYNLRVRNEMVASLLRYDIALKLAAEDASNLINGLTNLNERLVEEFKCAGGVYDF